MSGSTSSPRRRLLTAALLVGAVGLFLFLMLVWAGLFKSDVDQAFFGVANVNGDLFLVSCNGDGIGSAQFRAQGPDGPLLLEVQQTDAGRSDDAVSLTRPVDGYVAEGSLANGGGADFVLTALTSGTQKGLLFTILRVDPSARVDGSVAVHRDRTSKVISYAEFESEYPSCELPR